LAKHGLNVEQFQTQLSYEFHLLAAGPGHAWWHWPAQCHRSPGSSALTAKQQGKFSLPVWRDIYIVAPTPPMPMPGEESNFSWGCCSCWRCCPA